MDTGDEYPFTADQRLGVWMCEPGSEWERQFSEGQESVDFDIPDEALDRSWRLPNGSWLIPEELANRHRSPRSR